MFSKEILDPTSLLVSQSNATQQLYMSVGYLARYSKAFRKFGTLPTGAIEYVIILTKGMYIPVLDSHEAQRNL
jgi:hypothetical protein